MKEYVNTFMRYRFLLGELVKKGIKLKYRRSYLGIIWSLLEPLLTMMVLTIVFGTLFDSFFYKFSQKKPVMHKSIYVFFIIM